MHTGEGRIYLASFPGHFHITVHHWGKSEQKLKAGAEALEEHCLLASSWARAAHRGLGPPMLLVKTSLHRWGRRPCGLGNRSTGIPFLGHCVKGITVAANRDTVLFSVHTKVRLGNEKTKVSRLITPQSCAVWCSGAGCVTLFKNILIFKWVSLYIHVYMSGIFFFWF